MQNCYAFYGYITPVGYHKHMCDYCNCVWEHSDQMAGNDEAHKCPSCGNWQWTKYRGACEPTVMAINTLTKSIRL